MAGVRWTLEAQGWLREIHDYIAEENPPAAQRVLEGIIQKAMVLEQFPEAGYLYDRKAGVRILLYGHYRIAYWKNDDFIDILGVFHGALAIEKHLDLPDR